ncbi:MAG: hypothetical protein AB7G39_09070 [Alphaproteobacteria bacterium]
MLGTEEPGSAPGKGILGFWRLSFWTGPQGRGAGLALSVLVVGTLAIVALIVGVFIASALLRPDDTASRLPPVSAPGPIAAPGPTVVPDDRPLEVAIADRMTETRGAVASLVAIRIEELVVGMRLRLEEVFLPQYLSFPRRKYQELKAYNAYLLDWVHNLLTGDDRDTSMPALVADFEEAFLSRVVMPDDVRPKLAAAGEEAARIYLVELANGLEALRIRRGLSPGAWQAQLDSLPPLMFPGRDGRAIGVPLASLSASIDRLSAQLGPAIAADMQTRFDRTAVIVDAASLTSESGQNLFNVGSNATVYYMSFVVYWVVLIVLLQSGLLPVNLFGALVGWVVWEILSWGSWILYEWVQFGHTRQTLDPIIRAFAEEYFARLREIGAGGSFNALRHIETLFGPR